MRGSPDQMLKCSGGALVFCVLLSSCGGPRPSHFGNSGKLDRERETANDRAIVGKDWFNLSPQNDGQEGESINAVYKKLGTRVKDLAPRVVAVIDSGVDITHEDLKDHIWTNLGETGIDASGKDKASNGVDDDNNGYIDDIHGWNFIGGYDANGKPVHIDAETLEKTRILKKLQTIVESGFTLSEEDQKLFETVKTQVQNEIEEDREGLSTLNPALADIESAYPTVAPLLGNKPIDSVTRKDVESVTSQDKQVIEARDKIINAFDSSGLKDVARIKRFIKIYNDGINYNLNVDYDPRSQIVGDNPDDFTDVHYGNNDVSGVDNDHGTHVAGIIAADRNNALGIKGVSNSAQIMSIRTIPNGDERDKDVSLAIRYAADNGANIINMSFGKEFSPNRREVEEAIDYAVSKGVLLVHAAGNDAKDTTLLVDSNFPTPQKIATSEGKVAAWLEVGASSAIKGPDLPAVFSNYGDKSVDIFAPGFQVESSVPGNQYAVFSGTSMASPALAGAAALVWSVKPDMNANEVRELLLKAGRTYEGLVVNRPRNDDILIPILFSKLSITGKIADALNAVNDLLGL